MTKQQALALMNALETQQLNASAVMRFDTTGAETWNVTLDPSVSYDGSELEALASYCAAHGLTLTLIVQEMGVV